MASESSKEPRDTSPSEEVINIGAILLDPKVADWKKLQPWMKKLLTETLPNIWIGAVVRSTMQPQNVTVLLQKSNNIPIGFSVALPTREDAEVAYVYATCIEPEYQRQHLVGKIMIAMEEELRKRGFKYMTREARIKNGYADSIQRHYRERIVEVVDRSADTRFFKVTL